MNVNQLRDRILSLMHDEASPDTTIKKQALEWLNQAYHELMSDALPYLERYIQKEESMTTNGQGEATLSQDVYRIMQVLDQTNGQILEATTKIEETSNEAGVSTGNPKKYWIFGNNLNVSPNATVTLNVTYLPIVQDLEEDGTKESILLPENFHHALIWGGLVWSSAYERGFSAQGDLILFQRKWEEAKQQLKLSLANQKAAIRVEGFHLFE